jgi:DNA-binding transcriptional MerR regulator
MKLGIENILKGEPLMLSIGEFSNICKVSTKTLLYYAEIGLILPDEINPKNGYRYYTVKQLETMLFINRLKSYNFSLEEIKSILESKDSQDEKVYLSLNKKKKELYKQVENLHKILSEIDTDLLGLRQGKSIMSYMDTIDIQLVEVPMMYLLSIRKMVNEYDFADAYSSCFSQLNKKIEKEKLTIIAPPMVLFHSSEFSPLGLDTEFAIPVKEYVTGTNNFSPGLCLKTVLNGSYTELSSVYTKQIKWAEKEGYVASNALYEVYAVDSSNVSTESELVTEVYYPVKKNSTSD